MAHSSTNTIIPVANITRPITRPHIKVRMHSNSSVREASAFASSLCIHSKLRWENSSLFQCSFEKDQAPSIAIAGIQASMQAAVLARRIILSPFSSNIRRALNASISLVERHIILLCYIFDGTS
jgi:hypothetical protein